MLANLLISLLLCALTALPSAAWGLEGHRVIARIAQQILERDGALTTLQNRVGSRISLAEIAGCADAIRDFQKKRRRDIPPACLLGLAQINRLPETEQWHFVNIPVPASGKSARHDRKVLRRACEERAPCITEQIRYFARQLKRGRDEQERLVALLFLTHLVGDLHQPLHAVDRNGDQGGNKVFVRLRGKNVRLHSLWDTALVAEMGSESALVDSLNSQKIKLKSDFNPEKWAWESFDSARNVVYAGVPDSRDEKNPALLSSSYAASAEQSIRLRLAAAAVRLARVIEESIR